MLRFRILSFILFYPFLLGAQPKNFREAFIKNNILEVRVYQVNSISKKQLSTIQTINDSGLVVKSISFYISDDSLSAFLADTGSVTTYEYDLQNRETKEISVHDSNTYVTERSYPDKNTETVKYTDRKGTITYTYSFKERNRKHLTVFRHYRDGKFQFRTRIRKFRHTQRSVQVNSIFRKRQDYHYHTRRSVQIRQLDALDRMTSYHQHSRNSIFTPRSKYNKQPHRRKLAKRRTDYTRTFAGDLTEKDCRTYDKEKTYCYLYEYKRGIKLREK